MRVVIWSSRLTQWLLNQQCQKWFDQGLKHIDQLLIAEPPPAPCPTYEDSEWANDALAAYIDEMKYEGWAAVNKEAGIAMYGCENTTNTVDCFKNAKDWSAEWGNGVGSLKEVLKVSFKTSFWTRSSADGRFIGNGGGHEGGATITDMIANRDIKVKGSYDPGFFPDNSGFIMQGSGTKICTQASLETADIIDFDTPGCMKGTNINLYQHVARGLNGGDYFIINSQFTSDSGRGSNKDPVANFDAGSSMKFSPMIFNGVTYEQLTPDVADSPFEGDSVLSPSTRLVISRQGGGENGASLGYVIREVHAQKEGSGYNVTLGNQMARVCLPGAKANISYDERFFVTHHYEGPTANIHMVDMLTQKHYQVTNVPEGSKALFPHFRSDGWFYFLMRTGDDEYVVASDFAAVLLNGGE